jgi:hypothetical protein
MHLQKASRKKAKIKMGLQVPSGKRVFSLYGSQDYNINQILVKEGNFFRVFERGSAISEEGEALNYKRNGIIKLGVDFGEGYGNLNYTAYKAFLPTHRVIEILKEDKDFYYLSMDVELDYSGHKKNENTDGIQEISFDKSPDEQGAQVFADEDGVVELLKKEGLPKKALKLPVNGGIIYKIFWDLKTNVASWSKDAYSIRIQ